MLQSFIIFVLAVFRETRHELVTWRTPVEGRWTGKRFWQLSREAITAICRQPGQSPYSRQSGSLGQSFARAAASGAARCSLSRHGDPISGLDFVGRFARRTTTACASFKQIACRTTGGCSARHTCNTGHRRQNHVPKRLLFYLYSDIAKWAEENHLTPIDPAIVAELLRAIPARSWRMQDSKVGDSGSIWA